MTAIGLSPATATVVGGGSQSYTATAYSQEGAPMGNVTSSTVFSILPEGSCTANVCTAYTAGAHTVTGHDGAFSATATLNVSTCDDNGVGDGGPTDKPIPCTGNKKAPSGGGTLSMVMMAFDFAVSAWV